MGRHELEAALRDEGVAKARDIWREVEREAEQLRTQTEVALRQAREEESRKLAQERVRLSEEAGNRQQRQARIARLEAEQLLAGRLARLAAERLARLAAVGGAVLFDALADEVPAGSWRRIQVHPRDRDRARTRFPAAEIVTDERISGGLLAEDLEARVTIVNTLEKRLEHCWPLLLPAMMEALRRKVGDDAVA